MEKQTTKPGAGTPGNAGPPRKKPVPNMQATGAFEQTIAIDPRSAKKPNVDATGAFGDPDDMLLDPNATAPPTGPTDDGMEINESALQTAMGSIDEGEATQMESAPAPSGGPTAKDKISSLGGFKLLKKLGEGGMGAVFKAQDVALDRTLAIKVLAKHLASNKSFIDRFNREAKAMARLDHPNIVRCYRFGEEHGMHYLAIEFIDGGSMEDWVKKLGKLSVGDAIHVIIACASALEHAYADHKMIHRDIKPDNILLTKKGIVKVADMGLAKSASDDMSLTQTGTGAGTPVYMAPEQFKDAKHVDNRSDIYSLGCMLYKFLTGVTPFAGETYVELFTAKEKGKYPPARKANSDVPDRLDLIIDKTLAVKPDQRYKTCADLIKDLEGLGLANERLSFIEGSVATSRPSAASTASQKPAPGSKPPAPTSKTPGKPAEGAAPAEDYDTSYWYVKFKEKGKLTTRKLTETQLVTLIKSDAFDPDAQASRMLKDGYRSLAAYREFEPLLRGRINKERADRKTEKMQSMYKQIEKEYDREQKQKGFRRLLQKMGNGVMIVFVLAILAAAGAAAYFFIIKKHMN